MKNQTQQNGRVKSLKSDRVELRLLPEERAAFQDSADLAGIPLSAWIRERLRQAATRELEAAALPISFLESIKAK